MPDELVITAETDDGVIMGLAHRNAPVHGVQFHPESIASEHGHTLLQNFLQIGRHLDAASQLGPNPWPVEDPHA